MFNGCTKDLGIYYLSSYYAPARGQKSYFGGSYGNDYYVNCSGSCFHTASGYNLKPQDANKIIACPPQFKFGTRFKIVLPKNHPSEQKELYVRCEDRGGAIKGRRLDLWIGAGKAGEEKPWIQYSSHNARIFQCL